MAVQAAGAQKLPVVQNHLNPRILFPPPCEGGGEEGVWAHALGTGV
jgi:hypothetical protein